MHGAAGLTRHRKSTFHSEGKMNKMRSRSAASEENVKTPGKYGRFRKHRVLWVTRSVLWNTGSGSPSGQEPRARTAGKVAAAIPARIADGNRRDAFAARIAATGHRVRCTSGNDRDLPGLAALIPSGSRPSRGPWQLYRGTAAPAHPQKLKTTGRALPVVLEVYHKGRSRLLETKLPSNDLTG